MSREGKALLWVNGLLFGLGLVAVFSASSYRSVCKLGTPYFWFTRQLLWSLVGLGLLLLVYYVDYRLILRMWPWLFAVTAFALALVFVPHVGRPIHNSARWIRIGNYLCQPSELAKFTTITCIAGFLISRKGKTERFFSTFLPLLSGVVVCFLLILAEPDLGTSVFIFSLAVVIMLVGGVKVWYLPFAGILASPALAMFAYKNWSKIVHRFKGMLHPEETYQVKQSLIALGSGGAFGKGLGLGRAKFGYLPEPFNDFIFGVLGEELGFAGCAGVILLFGCFLVLGLRIAFRAADFGGFLLAFGATFAIVFQAVINIAVVSGRAPTKGISLPFISYGGSGLVLAFAEVGLILNVARAGARTQLSRVQEEPGEKDGCGTEHIQPAAETGGA